MLFTHYQTHSLLLVSLILVSIIPRYAAARAIETRTDEVMASPRERIDINRGWRFTRFTTNPDSLSYDILKDWIMPSGNDFLDGTKYERPSGTPPGNDLPYLKPDFDDGEWDAVHLPHDWAIKGPFNAPGVSGSMGRLPSNGVGWYRKTLSLAKDDLEKTIFLDIDGAMSYSAVWLNGRLVGGWPYGYNSFRLDLTPYVQEGDNQLAIRLENQLDSSRWYPGAGLYRNVWLVKLNPVHVRQYGTYITTPKVSADSATIDLTVDVENMGTVSQDLKVETAIYEVNPETGKATGDAVAHFPSKSISISSGKTASINTSLTLANPKLWGPPPTQTPNLYVAITTLTAADTLLDTYETPFGIRTLTYDPNKGLLVNNKHIRVQGTCNHHDHGSLGAAFNAAALTRQLTTLQSMGANALRTSHNPPAPEFLSLADRMGLLVYDEIFDVWENSKMPNDFHLIFRTWHEQDLRSFIRRDRNHPAVIAWGIGNEISEENDVSGGVIGSLLRTILRAEDATRPVTAAMNTAPATSALSNTLDLEGLNYQGEGLGTSMDSSFPSFHSAQPGKMIWTSESASAVSTRGTYIYPVTPDLSAPVGPGSGGNDTTQQISSYELYATSWGSSADKVFTQQDLHPYVAGEFVWTGFDYLGEPTPYDDGARSSYFGIVDLAGFPKDRFYLYQARWRDDLRMAHILPHWDWPERVGRVTPVHVFSSGDEAELFVNGKSAGRKGRDGEYRFRWDEVVYEGPGELHVVTYKDGEVWAEDTRRSVGAAAKLTITADRSSITSDGYDISYLTVFVVDATGVIVPRADNEITFSIAGPGELLATDNGNPADFTAFPSPIRNAFSGLALGIIRAEAGASGDIVVSVTSPGLVDASVTVTAQTR